jgi:hypothetical protein
LARGGMYEELQMVLSVKCYTYKYFSKKLLQLMHKILQTTPLYLFSAYVPYFEKIENAYEITFLTVYPRLWMLGNGSIKIPLSLLGRQWLGRNVNTVTNTHTTEDLLYASFSMWPVSYQRK